MPLSRNLSLRGLRTFVVAAEHESFRDAAERLFVTASAVSHQIRNLEEELGKRLFDRNGRAVRLTEAGDALYRDISPLVREIDLAASRHRMEITPTTLSISVQPFFASELLVPRLPQFRERHPDINILMDTSDESPEKHPSKVDVSIRIFRSPPEHFAADRLFPLRLVPAGTREFHERLKVQDREIVSDFPLIVHGTRPKAWQNWSRSSGIALPKVTTSLQLDSMIAVARAAERGLGAALVPRQLSDGWFRSGSLVPLFPHELTMKDSYYFVCRQDDADDKNVRLLREWVLQEFADFG